ncbi:MAG: hypothetical protein KC912_07330 [Proteobacteria bacterium]|nr:hypothetical protein [Pseudomonadota bacterium]
MNWRILLPLTLAGCFLFEPTETGPSAMVGRLLSPRGVPVRDIELRSLEARSKTDAGGEFSVVYKEPNQNVTFMWEGASYRRIYRSAEDHGKRLDLRLPEVRNAVVDCSLPETCDLKLHWDLGDGLTASARARCVPGEPSAPLLGVPKGMPAATCGQGSTATSLGVQDHGEVLLVSPPAVRVEVRVVGEGATDCSISIRSQVTPGLAAEFDLLGTGTASAVCAGIPSMPAVVGHDVRQAELAWRPEVAWFSAPAKGAVRLVAEAGPLAGVATEIPQVEGQLRLPVGLPAGSYRLISGAQALLTVVEAGPAGVVSAKTTTDGWGGSLVLEAPLPAGRVPVQR